MHCVSYRWRKGLPDLHWDELYRLIGFKGSGNIMSEQRNRKLLGRIRIIKKRRKKKKKSRIAGKQVYLYRSSVKLQLLHRERATNPRFSYVKQCDRNSN